MNHDPDSIIQFWYSDEVRPLWFNSTDKFDQELHNNYISLYEAAYSGQLRHWEDSANGTLALIIILDQFPLNIFRGQARAFEAENEAQRLVHIAIQKNYHKDLAKEKLIFLFMPLMHSEKLSDQDLAVQLYGDAGLDENAKYANHHRDIVAKFGRFPHRNQILGRESTQAEQDYLNSKEAFLG